MRSDHAIRAWARSGAMALTGRADGPPLVAPGAPALMAQLELASTAVALTARSGTRPDLPDVGVLGERAAISGFSRRGPWSCGGSFRTLTTSDGWVGISLARQDDLDLVPALVESTGFTDPWDAIARWARTQTSATAAERMLMLNLPGRAVSFDDSPATRPGVQIRQGGRRQHTTERPLVVDLTSLWAGPLCAHLLGRGGADVIKVESTNRPDGARRGSAEFFDLLHAGHRSISLDFQSPPQVEQLIALLSRADLVLEASRPRALARLGVPVEELVAGGTSWLSITASGRDSDEVGFGDDVAVGAGLHVRDGDELLPCADALADPLTGIVAARAASEALLNDTSALIDVSMYHVCREAALAPPHPEHVVSRTPAGAWQVDTGQDLIPVAAPAARCPDGRAAALGADTLEVMTR